MEKLEALMVQIFCSSSPAEVDRSLKNELISHLAALEKQGHTTIWSEDNIVAGADKMMEIDKKLEETDIILSLFSSDYIESADSYKMWQKAIKLYEAKKIIVIPIVIRPFLKTKEVFADIPFIPKDGGTIATASNRDEALAKTVEEIQTITYKVLSERYLKKANDSIVAKDLKSALSYCERAIEVGVNPSVSFSTKGDILCAFQRYQEAIESYKKAIDLNPKEASYYAKIGDIQIDHLDLPKEALESYKKAIDLNPKETSYYAKYGNILSDYFESYDNALHVYRIAVGINPKNPVFHDKIGDISFNHLNAPRSALISYKLAVDIDPKEPSYHAKIGDIWCYFGRYEDAILSYRAASQLDPKNVSYYNQIGSIFDKYLKKPKEAIGVYKNAVQNNPNEASFYCRIGDIYFYKIYDYFEALQAYKKASEISPNEARYYDLQALVYEKLAQNMRKKAARLRGRQK